MSNLIKRLIRWSLGAEYTLEEWRWEHKEKMADLTNTLEKKALKMLGYEIVCNLKADYFVEGQLPNPPLDSLYTLQKIEEKKDI